MTCALLFVAFWIVGCGGPPDLHLGKPPWSDGEVSYYTALSAAERPTGAASWTWQRSGAGWLLHEKRAATWGTTEIRSKTDAELHPVSVERTAPGSQVVAKYGERSIDVTHSAKGVEARRMQIERPTGSVVDNELVLQALRAAPLEAGYTAKLRNVVDSAGVALPTEVRVAGSERIEVPAGAFDTWHVQLSAAGSRHQAWYAKRPPHLLVKYENGSSGNELLLRAWRRTGGETPVGSPEPPALEEPGTAPFAVGIVITSLVIGVPVMILVPLLLGYTLRRRLGVGLRVFWAGALTFVVSQVVHLPLNWAVGLLGAPRLAGLLPLVWLSLAAGLSAGLCEELARYVALRFAMKRTAKSWSVGLQFGAGHGGIESMLLGLMAALTVGGMIAMRFIPPESLGLTGQAAAQVGTATDAFWSTPAYLGLVGAVERLMAITAHVAMTLLVVRSIAKKQPLFLAAAVLAHTLLDAWAVWSVTRLGVAWTEAGIAVFTLLFVALIVALRRGEAPAPSPALDVAQPS